MVLRNRIDRFVVVIVMVALAGCVATYTPHPATPPPGQNSITETAVLGAKFTAIAAETHHPATPPPPAAYPTVADLT